MSAGGKYHLYRSALSHPRFRQMTEFEFENEACYLMNKSVTAGSGATFGFGGRVLINYDFHLVPGRGRQDPSSIEGIATFPPEARGDVIRQRVSLTDFRTFAVILQCWEDDDQKSWDVFSLTPELDRQTQRRIEEHVEALGYKRENAVFLNYDNCRNLDGPLRGTNRPDESRNSQGGLNRVGGSRDSQGGQNRVGGPRGNQGGQNRFGEPRDQSRGLGWSSN